MKRRIIKGLAFVLSVFMLLTACSGKRSDKDGVDTKNEKAVGTNISDPGTFPIVKEKTNLKIMVAQDQWVESYEDNEFTRWFEEKTNVHIDWDVTPGADSAQKLNIVLAGGSYPDVFMGFNIKGDMQSIYGSQGAFLKLNDMVDKYAVEYKKLFKDFPFLLERVTQADGSIYGLPEYRTNSQGIGDYMWIYTPWLDKLGLKMPSTTEEFYQVLKAFKEKDPNGNGKADEIPIAASYAISNGTIDGFLMNAFMYTPPASVGVNKSKLSRQYLNNGKYDLAYDKEEYREGLRYLNKLYTEKLIAPDSFTMDKAQLTKLVDGSKEPVIGCVPGLWVGAFANNNGERAKSFMQVPPLKGPKGVQGIPRAYDNGISEGKYVITKDCKNSEIALRLADALLNEEIMMRARYGVPEVNWRKALPGELNKTGEQGQIRMLWYQLEKPQKTCWIQNFPTRWNYNDELKMVKWNWDGKMDPVDVERGKNDAKYISVAVPYEKTVPSFSLTPEKNTQALDLEKPLADYINEMNARFIIGDKSLDKDWDTYVKELEKMKIKEYKAVMQEALDIKKKK